MAEFCWHFILKTADDERVESPPVDLVKGSREALITVEMNERERRK